MIFTDEHHKLLAEARAIRPDCVIEIIPRETDAIAWRNDGCGVYLHAGFGGTDRCRFRSEPSYGGGDDRSRLLSALRASRVLGTDGPDAEWVRELMRENGIRVPEAEKWEPKVGERVVCVDYMQNEFTGTVLRNLRMDMLVVIQRDDGQVDTGPGRRDGWYVDRGHILRPAAPPPPASDLVIGNGRASGPDETVEATYRDGALVGVKRSVQPEAGRPGPDPYRHCQQDDLLVMRDMLTRDAKRKSQLASLLKDFDRPLSKLDAWGRKVVRHTEHPSTWPAGATEDEP